MGKYINYERLEGAYSKKELKEVFEKIIRDGWEIIFYHEKIQDIDRLHVVIICGIPNKGIIGNL